MIIVKMMGGLGNQMFQYAFGKALSFEYGEDVIYDTSWYSNKRIIGSEQKTGFYRRLSLHHFNIGVLKEAEDSRMMQHWKWMINAIYKRLPILSRITNYVLFDEIYPKPDLQYHQEVWNIHAKNICYIGYWQTEKYFSKYRDEILHDFQITTPQSDINRFWAEKIRDCNSVALHVRRSDYSPEWQLKEEYYQSAIEYVMKNVENPVFFVFSDDMKWAKKNLKIPGTVNYMEQNSQAGAYEDMRLMSLCKHNIIANSSFSWWAAWLNQNDDKIVVAPSGWISGLNIIDIIPDGWIKF